MPNSSSSRVRCRSSVPAFRSNRLITGQPTFRLHPSYVEDAARPRSTMRLHFNCGKDDGSSSVCSKRTPPAPDWFTCPPGPRRVVFLFLCPWLRVCRGLREGAACAVHVQGG